MVDAYGREEFYADYDGVNKFGFMLLPGILRGWGGEKMCIALFEIDLSLKRKYDSMIVLCADGAVSLYDGKDAESEKLAERVLDGYMGWEGFYTADIIPCEAECWRTGELCEPDCLQWGELCKFNMQDDDLPDEPPSDVRLVLSDFRNHKAELLPGWKTPQERSDEYNTIELYLLARSYTNDLANEEKGRNFMWQAWDASLGTIPRGDFERFSLHDRVKEINDYYRHLTENRIEKSEN